MKILTKIMYTLHRILGTLLSILFLVWFLSAFVMMYHGFPRVTTNEQIQKFDQLSAVVDSLPSIEKITAQLPNNEKIKGVTLNSKKGEMSFHIRTTNDNYDIAALSTRASTQPTDTKNIEETAALWCNAPVSHIDTLHKLDQWIPYGELKTELPIYKFYFNDKDRHQLYISSQSGEVLQFTTKSERFWAWVGPIPHWVYFTWLKQNEELWSTTIITLAAIGCLMVIAGMWVTVDVWRKTRRSRRNRFSPYRKRWYHWHYVTGIIFGIFVLTFTFSGMMSVADIPEWIAKSTLKNPVKTLHAKAPLPDSYALDYRSVLKAYPKTKQLQWSNFRAHPYYTLNDGQNELYIDASDTLIRPLQLTEKEIRKAVESVYLAKNKDGHSSDKKSKSKDSVLAEKQDGKENVERRMHAHENKSNEKQHKEATKPDKQEKSVPMHIELLNHYETYYRDMSRMYRGRSLLPVWKISVDDADGSVFYIHPETGNIRYVNTTARWKYWTYTALHRFRFPGLNSNGILRKTLLWVILAGGTIVSITGVALSVTYIRRKARKNGHNRFHK